MANKPLPLIGTPFEEGIPIPPFEKGGTGGISQRTSHCSTHARRQASVGKSPLPPLFQRGESGFAFQRGESDQRGQALISALLTTAVLLPLGAFAVMQARLDAQLAQRTRTAAETLAVAESGLEHALAELGRDPRYERLLLGADGRAGTSDDGEFPFATPPPAAFPAAPFRYEVRVAAIDAEHLELTARGVGPFGAVRAVAAALRRAALPYFAGAVASDAPLLELQLGDGWRLEGATSDTTHPAVPALAVRGEDVAAAVLAALPAGAAARLLGPGATPSLRATAIPSGAALIEAARQRSDVRSVIGTVGGGLGDGLFLSPGALRLSDASGSGILLVDGPLELGGAVSFAGRIVVNGDVRGDAGATVAIDGGLLQGAAGRALVLRGTGMVRYDARIAAALGAAYPTLLPRPAQITGWRELAEAGS